MFLGNKYYRWYLQIIERAKQRGQIADYTEKHHILPRCMGGRNTRDNLVVLPFREHYLAHWLLAKCVEKKYEAKLLCALFRMGQGHLHKSRPISSWQYARARRAIREAGVGPEHRKKISLSRLERKAAMGYLNSPETRERMSAATRGKPRKPRSEETRCKIRVGVSGRKHTDEALGKMRGRKWTPEYREFFAKTMRGRKQSGESVAKRVAANSGKKRSVEARTNLSNGQRGRVHPPETREKIRQIRLGSRQSERTILRKKQSALMRKLFRQQQEIPLEFQTPSAMACAAMGMGA